MFKNASFAAAETKDRFSTVIDPSAKPVRAFVPLPEPFPSENIGKPLPPLNVFDLNGQPHRWSPQAKPTVLIWFDLLETSQEAVQRSDLGKECSVQWFYVDYESTEATQIPAAAQRREALMPAADRERQSAVLFDLGLKAGKLLGVKTTPRRLSSTSTESCSTFSD